MKTIKVTELKNIMRVIAEEKLKHEDVYRCTIDGEKVNVIK